MKETQYEFIIKKLINKSIQHNMLEYEYYIIYSPVCIFGGIIPNIAITSTELPQLKAMTV